MKKYFLHTNGCYLNRVDTKRIEVLFKDNGWRRSQNLQDANIIIFNTCAYEQNKEDDCISLIERFKKEKDRNSRLVVAGCLPIINKPRMRKSFDGEYLTPHTISRLADIIGANSKKIEEIPTAQTILSDQNTFSGKKEKMFCIRIAQGCLNHCSFCAVKSVFPKFISKPKKEIVKEFKRGLKKGHSNLSLSAEDPSVYGKDIGTNLVELLKNLLKIRGKFTISLYRLNPEGLLRMEPAFIKILKSKKIVFLSIPLNSGSDRIIRLMNRKYKVSKVQEFIKKLKKMSPFLRINLDIMVGFPGETEEDFRRTMEFIIATRPYSIRVFKFTDRPSTTAKYLGRKIPLEIMNKRSSLLYRICGFANTYINKNKLK